jgi:purine-nucleoside phosphorylase
MNEYGATKLIRIGTAGGFAESMQLGDVVMAISASTDSNWAHTYELNGYLAPTASWKLLKNADKAAEKLGIEIKAGNIITGDVFYEGNPDWWRRWARLGVLAVDMEAAALYMNAAYYGRDALALVTISDQFATGEKSTVQERLDAFTHMMEIALETIIL